MLYKQLPNIKQYNKNGDKIDPFCGNFKMPEFSEVAYSGDYYDLSNIPDITSSDNSISITRPFSNDSDVNSFDLTLNTSTVELIDFTNFHNYYIREVTDWTSENDATIKHYVVNNVLTGEELTIVDTSQAGDTNTSFKAKFKFERNAIANDSVYIPMICVDATDFEALVNVTIEFADEGAFNTNVFILADTPGNFSWCFAKNVPFNIEGKRNVNQLLAFIEVPSWFTGSIEISIKRLHIQLGSNIFSYKDDTNASLGYSYASFNSTNEYDVAVFTDLTGFTDIYPTSNDNYGVLDVDFFVDSVNTLEIQSDNSIPDWIVNTLYTNEVALRNRMNEIILRNTQLNFDNYYTKSEVDTALGNKQASITITNNTSTPADNDTVIMQASGTTNTTSFLRRTMSKIWDYIKGNADSRYYKTVTEVVNMTTLLNYNPKFYSTQDNDFFYAYDKRPSTVITWKTYNVDNDELISDNTSEIHKLFTGAAENTGNHPKTGEYDIIEISKSDSSNIIQYLDGPIWVTFYYNRPPEQDPIIKATLANEEVLTLACTKFVYSSTCALYRFDFPSNKNNLRSLNIKIIGKSFGTNLDKGAFPVNIYFTPQRRSLSAHSGVTKFPVKQDLYGDVEAPKFIKRGGTSQQVLLANGETISMPSAPGTNKDTLLKNLISGLTYTTTDLTDTTEIVASYSGADGFGTSGQVNVPFKRRMTKVWDYIKGKADLIYVSTAASQGLNSTAKSNAKANIGLDNVDNTSDATKKTNFTGSIASSNTGFVTGGDVYTALNSRYKTITVTDDNYTNASLFNDVRPGDVIDLNVLSLSADSTIDIAKCNHCFIFLSRILDFFKLNFGGFNINVHGNLQQSDSYMIGYMENNSFYILSNDTGEQLLRLNGSNFVTYSGGIKSNVHPGSIKTIVFSSQYPITKLVVNITNEKDLLLLNQSYNSRLIQSFGDVQHPSDTTRCSTFNGFFPENVLKYTNNYSWQELFLGCGFSLDNDYTINPSGSRPFLNKAFYYAYSYNSHITNVDLTEIGSSANLTSCFESADGFNVILDGVDLTNNTCTDMFKDAKNITISAIGCNQDTIDKINANISGSYTSTITVITTDPNA